MIYFKKVTCVIIILLAVIYVKDCRRSTFQTIDKKYHLVNEAYNVAKFLFIKGRTNYDRLKNTSLHVMDTFLDLVRIMNNEMSKELRSALIKFYKLKYFHDFTNYIISFDEITEIIEHCLIDPIEKINYIGGEFRKVIKNFEDIRHFATVNKCIDELPDEVAAVHCILHQAVLFNETMQENLVSIVEIKTTQHARDMNASLYAVRTCLSDLVPHFYEQLLVDTYTEKCVYLKVANSSIQDLIKDQWRTSKDILFPKKWSPFVGFLKERSSSAMSNIHPTLLLNLLSSNLTTQYIKNIY